jgi:hypothetical protein
VQLRLQCAVLFAQEFDEIVLFPFDPKVIVSGGKHLLVLGSFRGYRFSVSASSS